MDAAYRDALADRFGAWPLRELLHFYTGRVGTFPPLVLSHAGLVDRAVALLVADEKKRLARNGANIAAAVAWAVADRWRSAGATSWARDALGRPEPWTPRDHRYVASYDGTTPSGRTYLSCASCPLAVSPIPPRDPACPGFGSPRSAVLDLVLAIRGGVRYEVDATGLPRPFGPVALCPRCETWGPWTRRDQVRQLVCDACAPLPFPVTPRSLP